MSELLSKQAIEAVWRIESTKVIGGLARLLRDLTLAEDMAQEALLAALEAWPQTGFPNNPGAWLMTTAKNKAFDLKRRQTMIENHQSELEHQAQQAATDELSSIDETLPDDVLRLMFVSCHPVLSREARLALTLHLIGGLTTAQIARAFLQSESTIAQRIVRAKRTISEARVPFEIPHRSELKERLSSVLEVIYLLFNEGYAATCGEQWFRRELCHEALRLGRILSALVGDEPEVHGLVALMEIQASRLRARTDSTGQPVLLLDQNRALWDFLAVQRGLAALAQADRLATPRGPYVLQAAIAACHARAKTAQATDWSQIVALYDALVELTGSPIVELNRAVAVGMAEGPAAGLELLDQLVDEPALQNYSHSAAARAELLSRLGRFGESQKEFEKAAKLTQNRRERDVLVQRALECQVLAGTATKN